MQYIMYLLIVLTDGDYLNDWLTHMPADVATYAEVIGRFVSTVF